jgi:hypothetical protein
MSIGKKCSPGGQFFDVRSFYRVVFIENCCPVVHVVYGDEENVGPLAFAVRISEES